MLSQLTNENFKVKRCWGEFTAFIFLFLIAYLSGINASLQMATMEVSNANSTDAECMRYQFKGCKGLQEVFTKSLSESFCSDRPVYRSPLIFKTTSSGLIGSDEATFNEIFSLIDVLDGTRVWLMQESTVDLDEDGFAVSRATLKYCGMEGVHHWSYNDAVSGTMSRPDRFTSSSKIVGSGCVNCDPFKSTTNWLCWNDDFDEYRDLSTEKSPVIFKEIGEGSCHSWRASRQLEFCDGKCAKNTKAIGWLLFVFYALVPLYRLWMMGSSVKRVLNGLEGNYEDSFQHLSDSARSLSTHSDFVPAKEVEGDWRIPILVNWLKEDEDVKEDLGIQLAVSSALLSAFEEKWWWWKLFLMTERGVLAACVFTEVTVWAAFVVTLIGVAGSFYTRPYWEDEEDYADLFARCSTLLTVFFACLAETEAINGDEVIVAIFLNLIVAVTLAMLVMAMGPRRMYNSAVAFYHVKRREIKMALNDNSADKIPEADALGMSKVEFLGKR